VDKADEETTVRLSSIMYCQSVIRSLIKYKAKLFHLKLDIQDN